MVSRDANDNVELCCAPYTASNTVFTIAKEGTSKIVVTSKSSNVSATTSTSACPKVRVIKI